jgi:hypothetical protein
VNQSILFIVQVQWREPKEKKERREESANFTGDRFNPFFPSSPMFSLATMG